NRHSLALRARAVVAAEAVERICRLRRQAAPGIGGRGRPHRLAEESNSPRTRTLFRLAGLANFFRREKRRREQREGCGRTFTTERGRSVRGTPIRYFGRGQAESLEQPRQQILRIRFVLSDRQPPAIGAGAVEPGANR